MRKNLGYCIVIVLVVFTVGASSTSFGQTDTGPALVMSNRSAELTQGSFANKGSLVLFLSWLEESRRARVSLEVNNVLKWRPTHDAGTDTLHWNGYNAALTPEDKEALVAFSRELEQSLGAATIFAERDMPLHERLLYERVLYWAEAPVGLPLTARTLSAADQTRGEACGKYR